jgi:hypothetical protein
MAEPYTFIDARTDKLIAKFTAAGTYLNAGLPTGQTVTVLKGPWDAGLPDPGNFFIYVSRSGLPAFEYGCKGDPVRVTQQMAVACVSSYPATREGLEEYVSYLAANTVSVLLGATQVPGAGGWDTGIIASADAVTLRSRNNTTFEIEVFDYQIKYEVTP